MHPIARGLCLCLALLSAGPLSAEPVEGLFRVREPLPQEQPDARAEGLRRAFDTLVLRLTGDAEASRGASLAALRNDPQPVITQYGYQADSVFVEFDAASVQKRLRDAGLGLWGANRPVVLVWWLNESPVETRLLGDGQESSDVLRAAAQHRGLPLRLPLADLSEQLAVTPEALGDPRRTLVDASSRYDADAVMAARAQQSDSGWQVEWVLSLGDAQTRGQVSEASLEAAADAVMRAAQVWMAPRFVGQGGAVEAVALEVEGADVAGYAQVQKLLEPLGARLVAVEGDRLVYALSADLEQLRAQLSLARLVEVPAEAPAAASEPEAPGIDATAPPAPSVLPATEARRLRFRW